MFKQTLLFRHCFFLFPYAAAVFLMLNASKVSAMNCPADMHRDEFGAGSGVSIVACASTNKFLGEEQSVVWGITNNSSRRIEVTFDKLYFYSCGKQEVVKAFLTLEPSQGKRGGIFSGDDACLGDSLFPNEACGAKKNLLNRVGINNLRIRELPTEKASSPTGLQSGVSEITFKPSGSQPSVTPITKPEVQKPGLVVQGTWGGTTSTPPKEIAFDGPKQRQRNHNNSNPTRSTNEYINNLTSNMQREAEASYQETTKSIHKDQQRIRGEMEEEARKHEHQKEQYEERIASLEEKSDRLQSEAARDAARSEKAKRAYQEAKKRYLDSIKWGVNE